MNLWCICGNPMSDSGSPNDTEHLLISNRSMEQLQDLVDGEVEKDGTVDMWPEHWEQSKALEVWKCYKCQRLYLNPKGPSEQVIVYSIEKVGIQ
jgi:hypothetical protein